MPKIDPARTQPDGEHPAPAMDGGLYLLLVRVLKPLQLSVGPLGDHRLPSGWFVYTGSARHGLRARADRHLRPEKRVRWHIDRLTVHPGAAAVGVVLLPRVGVSAQQGSRRGPQDDPAVSPTPAECALNQAIGRLLDADTPIPRFGAGDCRGGCPAHLWHSETRLSAEGLAHTVAANGLGDEVIVRLP